MMECAGRSWRLRSCCLTLWRRKELTFVALVLVGCYQPTARIESLGGSIARPESAHLEGKPRAEYARVTSAGRRNRRASNLPSLACAQGVLILSPCPAVRIANVNTSGTRSFTIQNTGPEDASITLDCPQHTGSVSSCSIQPPTQIPVSKNGGSANFTLNFTVGASPGAGTAVVTATDGADVVDDTLKVTARNVTATPDGLDTLVAPGAPRAVNFRVTNLDTQSALTVDLTTQCGPLIPAGLCQLSTAQSRCSRPEAQAISKS